MLASRLGVLVPVLAALLSIQFPADASGKALEVGLCTWASAALVGDLGGAQVPKETEDCN